MTGNGKIELGHTQETLLMPLYARALESRKARPLVRDPRAAEIIDSIDYDFAAFKGPLLDGMVLRSAIFDYWAGEFLREHPGGSVVEIGAGLNTRYERLDNGAARWLEIDLPDSMELRRRFFSDTDRRTMHTGSVTDSGWIPAARGMPGPWCFISEAVLMYLPEPEVRAVVGHIGSGFPGSTLLMDTWGQWIVDHPDKNDVLRQTRARITWACDNPAQMADWGAGVHLRDSRSLARPPDAVRTRLSVKMRAMTPLLRLLPQSRAYKVNRFTVPARPGTTAEGPSL